MRSEIADIVTELIKNGAPTRSIVAIAGAPGAGKSTFVEELKAALNTHMPQCADILAMDGFHFDDAVLTARGWQSRKGAPHTFDVGGLLSITKRLHRNDEPEIAVPLFDRSLEISRNGARIIPQSVRFVLFEGNYVLLEAAPWNVLSQWYDKTIFLEVPRDIITARLEARWQEMTPQEARAKIEENDLPNAQTVLNSSKVADWIVQNY